MQVLILAHIIMEIHTRPKLASINSKLFQMTLVMKAMAREVLL